MTKEAKAKETKLKVVGAGESEGHDTIVKSKKSERRAANGQPLDRSKIKIKNKSWDCTVYSQSLYSVRYSVQSQEWIEIGFLNRW